MDKGIIVVKIGTAVLSEATGRLDASYIEGLTTQVCELLNLGYKIVLVSSGAVGAGMEALKLTHRPKQLRRLQACAAIGQGRLMRHYEESFSKRGIHTAQILLTQDDFVDRRRFLNAKNTILGLINELKAVPIINENDTVATEEIRFGDNDILSALVATLIRAHTLVILTDVDGLYSQKDKKVIHLVTNISREIERIAEPSKGRFGIGGMVSKLKAAKVTMHSGITCIIANGRVKDVLLKIERKMLLGTTFLPGEVKAKAKKNWLAFSPKPKGSVVVDDGAKTALVKGNKSLLAAGIKAVTGTFEAGDVVNISTVDGKEFARGMVSFSSEELNNIKGLKTTQIAERLRRHITHNEVIHRDNLVILD